MKEAALIIIISLCCLTLTAQEAQLNTKLKPFIKQKINIVDLSDRKPETITGHGVMPTWVINSEHKFRKKSLILNYKNIEDIRIEKKGNTIQIKYKIDSLEILNLNQLARKYCDISQKNILFTIDKKLERKPDGIYIAIDAIKRIDIDDSKNYPALALSKKKNFKLVSITTVNPPKQEEEDNGNPKIMIR